MADEGDFDFRTPPNSVENVDSMCGLPPLKAFVGVQAV